MSVSLKRRLIGILSLLILFAWVGSALLTGAYAGRVLMSQVDRQLEQYLDLVGYITHIFASEVDEDALLVEPLHRRIRGQGAPESFPIVIEGNPSENLPQALNIWMGQELLAVLDVSPRFARPERAGFGFRHLVEDDSHWRILTRYDESTGLWLLVGVELNAARWAMLRIFGHALLPLLIILPLTALLLYFGVTRGLLPVKLLAGQIADRNPRVLDPVEKQGVPAEVEPVVDALNVLLERLAVTLEGEQRFTANAAHELMTPLAAIKTEVQLCRRQLVDTEGRAMLERIAARVDRASHTVEQLLTLARVDPDAPRATAPVALRALLREVLAETGHVASERGLRVSLEEGDELSVTGSGESLAILLRNLLINAFRYALQESEVRIELVRDRGGIVLEICNDCLPLSAEEFSRIGERFYRVPGGASLGAGLGLSIVTRIAEQHGAQFTVGQGENSTGFCARVSFPCG